MSYYIKVGAGRDEWAFPDPGSARVVEACRRARFGGNHGLSESATFEDGLVMASVVDAFNYLLRGAPSTKAAVDRLTKMRRALRSASTSTDGGTAGETREKENVSQRDWEW